MREFPHEQAHAMVDLNQRFDDTIDALNPAVAPLAAAVVSAHTAFILGFWLGRTALPSDFDADQVGEIDSAILNRVNEVVGQKHLKLTVEQIDTATAAISPLLEEMGNILDAAIGPPSNDRGLIIATEVPR